MKKYLFRKTVGIILMSAGAVYANFVKEEAERAIQPLILDIAKIQKNIDSIGQNSKNLQNARATYYKISDQLKNNVNVLNNTFAPVGNPNNSLAITAMVSKMQFKQKNNSSLVDQLKAILDFFEEYLAYRKENFSANEKTSEKNLEQSCAAVINESHLLKLIPSQGNSCEMLMKALEDSYRSPLENAIDYCALEHTWGPSQMQSDPIAEYQKAVCDILGLWLNRDSQNIKQMVRDSLDKKVDTIKNLLSEWDANIAPWTQHDIQMQKDLKTEDGFLKDADANIYYEAQGGPTAQYVPYREKVQQVQQDISGLRGKEMNYLGKESELGRIGKKAGLIVSQYDTQSSETANEIFNGIKNSNGANLSYFAKRVEGAKLLENFNKEMFKNQ